MARYILSIDGGGVRGIIAATILQAIQKKINKPIANIFDLIAGSSVGSLIGAALCIKDHNGEHKYNTSDILDILLNSSGRIFNQSMINKVISVVVGPMYSDKNLNAVLKEVFGDSTMNDLMVNFIVPSYNLYSNQTVMFRSWVKKYQNIKIRDVARAAVAAPTYFTPYELVIDNKKELLIDSSLVSNNPIIEAYAAAQVLYPSDTIYCLSIGCGTVNMDFSHVQNSLLYWGSKIIFVIIDAGLDAVDYKMERLVKEGDKYFRMSGDVKYATHDFSDATPMNIKNVQKDAKKILADNLDKIDEFCKIVLKDKDGEV
ncbi:patatin [Ehrlichia ruminantium]|uniref:patatin-like phospholipase family protein n=2 Tax=Ehrlichia ruminantium TaxID=779 RepID=UPI0007A012A5|nr:patatin-like phospholipase family protein [Ehrlichia ruminantium]KYX00025.1 patatin [Ehrlichia ruminantium]QLK50260.1 patatin [Ehrlichia ruminantium]QLK53019.1 patatin [Ehrlichia ruminantium]QLK58521.1 patatin [Ehrlichia ruminantium]